MTVRWRWLFLLFVLLARAAGDGFGPSAWSCAFHDGSVSSESISSEEKAAHQCVCHRAHETSTVPGMKLDCSRRNFDGIASGQKLPLQIRSIDMSWNNINFLERGVFDRYRPIEELIFSHNHLIKIADHALSGLNDLIVLNLSHNFLADLSGNYFMNLTSLRVLDLSWNYLEDLPPRIFRYISHLDTLSLSGNVKIGQYIFESPDALRDVLRRGLRRLEMNHLLLSALPPNLFNEAYSLEELHIAHNDFTKFPSLFVGSLQVLNISSSNMEVLLPGTFLTLPNLKEIHMNHMKHLTEVEEGALVGLKQLEILSLEKCRNLTSFDGMAFGGPFADIPPLRILSLKHSGLQTLSRKLQPFISNIEHLKLQGNPWDCNCKIRWFKQMNFSKEYDHVRCYFPESLHNRTISSVESSEFVCTTQKGRVLQGLLITMAILFSLITLLVILAFGDNLRRKYCAHRTTQRRRYDPLMVQLHPNSCGINVDDEDGPSSISFIRENRAL